eukprot:jgi/Mesvir1/9711/Mv12183-RA.1
MAAMEEDTEVRDDLVVSSKQGQKSEETVLADIEEARNLALKQGKLDDALEKLLNLEKQNRLAAEVACTKRLATAIVRLCYDAGDLKKLNEQIVLLSKRRSQLKQAVVAMVQEVLSLLEEVKDVGARVELIKTLLDVTAGKIYVEIERARLVRKFAQMKEDEGKLDEAAELMQEVAVETFGAMSKTEKVAFILEQVRLCLDRKDYVRASIMAKKISPRVFKEETPEEKEKKAKKKGLDEAEHVEAPDVGIPEMPVLKQSYYQLMIRYHKHSNDYLEICRCYENLIASPSVRDDKEQWAQMMKKIVWYIVLSPHDSMQSSLLHSTYADKRLDDLPKFKELLKTFITDEVVRWPALLSRYSTEMAAEELFSGEGKEKAVEDLHLRLVEHNLLVISKFYTRVTLKRLAELLDLTVPDAEKHLSEMVVAKKLAAKIDRPAGVVAFGKGGSDATEQLNTWSRSIDRLLGLVEKSCHQIHTELMVHKVTLSN